MEQLLTITIILLAAGIGYFIGRKDEEKMWLKNVEELAFKEKNLGFVINTVVNSAVKRIKSKKVEENFIKEISKLTGQTFNKKKVAKRKPIMR